ncbi:MAG: HNH endonuclease [Coxiellaceae bacterium]|nr:HNH endonuclease [Coxiellaceae bacterium]|tara:strand:+ start:3435 stop:4067 length:633 start_codon:yes stop_codon:yes gene_type:complete
MTLKKDYLSLPLIANQKNWQLYMVRKADDAFLAFEKKVLSRDQHKCQYCGFQSSIRMDVVNRDGNYANNKQSNLVTACPFCAQCHFIQSVGISDNTGGVLIYLPELSQAELNAMCHNLFAAMAMKTATAADAKNIYRSLRLRSQVIEKELGAGMSNPAFYGQVLLDAKADTSKVIHKIVREKTRLLPSLKAFSPLINEWSQSGLLELANS